jgi:hypothetical protein
MQRWRKWESASKVPWGLALECEWVVRALTEEPRLYKERLAQAMLQLGVSRSVLYDLVRRFHRREIAAICSLRPLVQAPLQSVATCRVCKITVTRPLQIPRILFWT